MITDEQLREKVNTVLSEAGTSLTSSQIAKRLADKGEMPQGMSHEMFAEFMRKNFVGDQVLLALIASILVEKGEATVTEITETLKARGVLPASWGESTIEDFMRRNRMYFMEKL